MNQEARRRLAMRRVLDAAAATHEETAVLAAEVGRRLVERLDGIRLQPERILDLGAATGAVTARLMRRYPKAWLTATELAPAMLRRVRRRGAWRRHPRALCAEPRLLPFAGDSFDLVFSNLTLQWLADPEAAFREIQRVLRPEGLLLFSTLGPDTLIELRRAWAAADEHAHVNDFIDLHDVGDALYRARLTDPVMDMEFFTLTYPSLQALHRDLRAQGASFVAARASGLTTPRRLAAVEAGYHALSDAEGRLPATWEVVYGHAWGSDVLPQRETEPGVTRVALEGIPRRARGQY